MPLKQLSLLLNPYINKDRSEKMMNIKHLLVLPLYRYLFVRKWLFSLNKAIFTLSLRGIGVLNSENEKISGESWFLNEIASLLDNSTAIDVGANVGNYSNKVKKLVPNAILYSFEPHPRTFEVLNNSAEQYGYEAINAGCGSKNGKANIYDYSQAREVGTSHASLYEEVISQIHSDKSRSWEVEIVTLDDFIEERNLDAISLVKIDVEGGEMDVLKGMKKAIHSNKINLIQFEFNEMNVFSRTFLKDIQEILQGYDFYRLLPDGAVSLGAYSAIHWEIFAYQNIVAVNQLFQPQLEAHKVRL